MHDGVGCPLFRIENKQNGFIWSHNHRYEAPAGPNSGALSRTHLIAAHAPTNIRVWIWLYIYIIGIWNLQQQKTHTQIERITRAYNYHQAHNLQSQRVLLIQE